DRVQRHTRRCWTACHPALPQRAEEDRLLASEAWRLARRDFLRGRTGYRREPWLTHGVGRSRRAGAGAADGRVRVRRLLAAGERADDSDEPARVRGAPERARPAWRADQPQAPTGGRCT